MEKSEIENQFMTLWIRSALVFLAMCVVSQFLPLGLEGKSNMEQALWLTANWGDFIVAWMVQIIIVIAFVLILSGVSWITFNSDPVKATVGFLLVMVSVLAFIIPKFMTVWSVPLMSEVIAANAEGKQAAEIFLPLMDWKFTFSLSASLDHLGFILWSSAILLLVAPLFKLGRSGKLAALFFGGYGVGIWLVSIAVLCNYMAQSDVAEATESLAGLLFLGTLSVFFTFREKAKNI